MTATVSKALTMARASAEPPAGHRCLGHQRNPGEGLPQVIAGIGRIELPPQAGEGLGRPIRAHQRRAARLISETDSVVDAESSSPPPRRRT